VYSLWVKNKSNVQDEGTEDEECTFWDYSAGIATLKEQLDSLHSYASAELLVINDVLTKIKADTQDLHDVIQRADGFPYSLGVVIGHLDGMKSILRRAGAL